MLEYINFYLSESFYLVLKYFNFFFQYPEYTDAYLRLAAIAKARNNVQISLELVVIL